MPDPKPELPRPRPAHVEQPRVTSPEKPKPDGGLKPESERISGLQKIAHEQAERVKKAEEQPRVEESKRPKPPESPKTVISHPEVKTSKPQEPKSRKEPKIAATPAPYIHYQERSQLIDSFKASGVEIPEEWDKWSARKRAIWLAKNHVYNISSLPQTEERPKPPSEPVLRHKEKNIQVIFTPEEKIFMLGLKDLSRGGVTELYKKAGFEGEIELPEDYDHKSSVEKISLLSEHGIEVLTQAGGGTRWQDNDAVPEDVIFRRLAILARAERMMGAAGFNAAGYNVDREELNLRLIREKGSKAETDRVISELVGYQASGEVNIRRRGLEAHLNYLEGIVRQSRASNENYEFVFHFNQSIEDFRVRAADTSDEAYFDAVIIPATRQEMQNVLNSMNTHFEGLEAARKPDNLKELYEKVDTEAQNYARSLRAGFYPKAEVIYQEILNTVRGEIVRELPGEKGLLTWHTLNLFERMKQQIEAEKELGTPSNWRNSMRNTLNNLRYVESTDLPESELSGALGRIEQIVTAIPSIDQLKDADEKKLAEGLRREINEMRLSVQAVYILRANMEGKAMTPGEIEVLFKSNIWKDDSYRSYFKRFFEDHQGHEYKDAHGNRFNMLDKAMQVYARRFRRERLMMNQVSEMTKSDLDSLPDDAYGLKKEFQKRIDEKIRTTDQYKSYSRGDWGKKMDITKEVINEWYRENTLLGAHGIDKPGDKNARKYLDIRKDEVREELKKDLSDSKIGLDGDTIQEYQDVGILDQVVNNSHYLNWSWGIYSDHDVIRIWDRNKKWFGSRRRLGAIAYNQDSNLWAGRMVDHYAEFLLDELRGRSGRHNMENDANYVVQKHMVGVNREFLPQNKLSVKIVNDNLSRDEEIASSLVVGGGNYANLLDSRIHALENIDKLDVDGDEDDKSWAKGAAVSEMIEDGTISFENVEWSKVFDKEDTNVSKFNMADWWNDRATTFNYFGPDAFQQYLNTPNGALFFEINTRGVFYSTRENRLKPWMKLVIPAHIELGTHWREWWKMTNNMTHAEKDQIIDYAAQTNRLSQAYHHDMKLRHTGWGPLKGGWMVRNGRTVAEMAGYFAYERGIKYSWATPWSMGGEFWNQFWKYMAAEFR